MIETFAAPTKQAPCSTPPPGVDDIRQRYAAFVDATCDNAAARRWRHSVFERGLQLADEIERAAGPLAGRRVLDVGAAHGGDIAALVARGAIGVGADLFDHDYDRLRAQLQLGSALDFTQFDCTQPWPFADHTFDTVISMSVIEIVDDLDAFFAELCRVLKPGGVALVDTGSALRMARRDPLYRLPLIALLPTPARRFVAERIFGRKYRFHVSRHTFYSALKFRRYVRKHGYDVEPRKFPTSRMMQRLDHWPLIGRPLQTLLRWTAYDCVLLRPRVGMAKR